MVRVALRSSQSWSTPDTRSPGRGARLAESHAGSAGRPARPGHPLEARYLLRLVTKGLRLGIRTPTILDALAQVYVGGRAARPVLESACNICCDLGLVACNVVHGGVSTVEQLRVRPGSPVRAMLAQRLSDATEILARLGALSLLGRSAMAGSIRATPGDPGSDRIISLSGKWS